MRAAPSKGLNDYKRVAKAAEKDTGKKTNGSRMPVYLDGSLYRTGDVVLEGYVQYYRPTREWEDDSEDALRFVVTPNSGGPAIPVQPSKTRAVSNRRDNP